MTRTSEPLSCEDAPEHLYCTTIPLTFSITHTHYDLTHYYLRWITASPSNTKKDDKPKEDAETLAGFVCALCKHIYPVAEKDTSGVIPKEMSVCVFCAPTWKPPTKSNNT